MAIDITWTQEHWDILDHTMHHTANGLYCGDSREMQDLVMAGFMTPMGSKSFCPDPYFSVSCIGRAAFNNRPKS